jgi:hypothetical protein
MGGLYDGYGMMLRHMVSGTVTRLHVEEVEEMFLSSIQ